MAGPERKVEDAFVAWCWKHHKLLARKLRELKRNGFPDRSVILPDGRLVCIEFKSPTGELDIAQQSEIKLLRNAGVPVLVTSELKEAQEWLLEQMSEPRKSGSPTSTNRPR